MAKQKKDNTAQELDFYAKLAKDVGGDLLDDLDKTTAFIDTGILSVNFIISGKFVGGGFPSGAMHEVSGESASGKCLGKDTPILMFDGTTKKVQDVKTGDLLMGDDSKPRTVLSTTKGFGPLYKVKTRTDERYKKRTVDNWCNEYVVNEHHILSLKMCKRQGRRWIKGDFDYFDISVKDWLSKDKTFKKLSIGYISDVEWTEKPVLIDPYFLGVWLGDGTSTTADVTTADTEIVEEINLQANKHNFAVRVSTKKDNKASTYHIHGKRGGFPRLVNPIKKLLLHYNLIDNKHIPQEYKTNSKRVRLEVLAGLMDTYGSATYSGYDFVNKSKTLAEDVVWLARSVGMMANISECTKKDQKGRSGTYYRVYIRGSNSIPCRIERKIISTTSKKHPKHIGKIDVTPIGNGEFYGFELDGNKRFLLGDFTVTHNSLLGTNFLRGCQTFGGIPVFHDAERAISKGFAIKASHIDPMKLVVTDSDTLEGSFNKIHKIIRQARQEAKIPLERPICIVYDSIAVSPSEREFAQTTLDMEEATQTQIKEAGAGAERPGERARTCSAELRKLMPVVKEANVCILFVNQLRKKIGIMFGDPDTTAGGGESLKYYCSTRLRMHSFKQLKDKNKRTIGMNVTLRNMKSRYTSPFQEAKDVHLFFDQGIDPFGGLLELMIQIGRVEGSNGNYRFTEPWAGGKEIKFKANKVSNTIPVEALLECPAVVDAKGPEDILYYQSMFGGASEEVAKGTFTEEDVKVEE